MCDWKMEAKDIFRKVGTIPLEHHFPKAFLEELPPGAVLPGHCLYCGGPMSHQEMHPAGKTPRYMHESCYEGIVLSGPKQFCLTCRGRLSQEQIYAQIQNPRELSHAFHSGPCKDYHAVLAGIVFGIPFKVESVPMLPYHGTQTNFFGEFSPRRASQVIDVKPIRSDKHITYLKFPK